MAVLSVEEPSHERTATSGRLPNLSTEDTITLLMPLTGVPDRIEFQLQTTDEVNWWKAIEVRSVYGDIIDSRYTEDSNHGPVSFSVSAADAVGARLTLAKAKWFGIHTGMYELQDFSRYAGQSFQFLWQRDEDSDGPVAGFFRDLGRGISQAADAVGNAVATVCNAVGEAVSRVVEAVGNFVAGILYAIGDFLGGIPLIGGFLRGLFRWLGSVVSAAFDFVATWIKGALNLVGAVVGGLIRVHECCHVWQNQHEGTRYILDALWAQRNANAYSWQNEIRNGRYRWADFNKEAQAAFIDNVYRDGRRTPTNNAAGEFYDDDPIGFNVTFGDYTGLARDTIAYVRNA